MAAQLWGLIRVSHLDRALRAVSHIAKSYISWKSGEQRMRDTYDSL
jgi:hypothetical protein